MTELGSVILIWIELRGASVKLFAQTPNSRRSFVIERDEKVGYYFYVFEGDRCTYDYLQDTLELAVEQASQQFNVPKDAWRTIEKPG